MGFFDFFKPKQKGISHDIFSSRQYQAEILAIAQATYFQNRQDYDAVKKELAKLGLNDAQAYEVMHKLAELNKKMVSQFENELDSGRITEIKIQPNPDHIKGNVDADQVDKYIGFGAWQMDRGDFDNALELFDKALELDAHATLAYANKGTLYARQGDNEKALYFYNKALEIEPGHEGVLENKLDVLLDMMDAVSEAEILHTVKAVLSNNPGHPNALVYIVQYYLKQNDIENALVSVKKLFTDYYRESVAIQLLLNVFDRLEQDRALTEFAVYKIRITPEAAYQLEYCRGLYLKGKGRYDEAINLFDDLNGIQQFSWNYYQMGIMKNLQGKTAEALDLLKNTFALEPGLKEDAKQFPELHNLWADPEFIKITR